MRFRVSCRSAYLVTFVMTTAVAPLVAQRTRDEALLVIGFAAGWRGGTALWSVSNQSVITSFLNGDGNPDTLALTRRMRQDLTVSAQGAYFVNSHLAYTGEFTYIGLGQEDTCTLLRDSGDTIPRYACAALVGREASASGLALQAGVIVRPWSRAAFQPYVRAVGGMTLLPRSTRALTSYFGPFRDNAYTIYTDNHWNELRPTATLALGVSTAPSSGYQLRVEFRETWVKLPVVTGPTIQQGLEPPSRTIFKGLPSLLIGFDIVLEHRPGHRY